MPSHDDESEPTLGGPLGDRIEELFTSPYMGYFDSNGLFGRYLKPVEEFVYNLPPPPPPNRYSLPDRY